MRLLLPSINRLTNFHVASTTAPPSFTVFSLVLSKFRKSRIPFAKFARHVNGVGRRIFAIPRINAPDNRTTVLFTLVKEEEGWLIFERGLERGGKLVNFGEAWKNCATGRRRGRIGIRSEFSSITHARKCGKNLIARGGRRGERK